MANTVYEVVEKSRHITSGWFDQENQMVDEQIDRQTFYMSLKEAKRHVKYWAEENGVQTNERGWNARREDILDYKYEFKEREIKEIDIKIHDVRAFFYAKAV